MTSFSHLFLTCVRASPLPPTECHAEYRVSPRCRTCTTWYRLGGREAPKTTLKTAPKLINTHILKKTPPLLKIKKRGFLDLFALLALLKHLKPTTRIRDLLSTCKTPHALEGPSQPAGIPPRVRDEHRGATISLIWVNSGSPVERSFHFLNRMHRIIF